MTRGVPLPRFAATVRGGENGVVDPEEKERLARLDRRISDLKKAKEPAKPHQDEHYSQANLAWRMVTELVAGLAIGFGIGYGLDLLFGTTPLLMVLFILLGFAAGVQTMLRTANEIGKTKAADSAEDEGD